MALYVKRKSLDRFTIVFYHQFLTPGKNGCNNVLPFELLPDKVLNTVNFNFPKNIYFSYKGDFSFRNGNIETASCIHVMFGIEPFRYLFQRLPQRLSEYSRKPCAMVFLRKSAMRFFILIIPQKSLIDFPQSRKRGTRMSSQYSFLPKIIKTLNRGISSRLTLWNKYHLPSQPSHCPSAIPLEFQGFSMPQAGACTEKSTVCR